MGMEDRQVECRMSDNENESDALFGSLGFAQAKGLKQVTMDVETGT